MRVAFCGGGTGGHVYPALTVAQALRQTAPSGLDLLYIGVKGKIDAELVAREGMPFQAVTAGPLRVGSPLGSARGAALLARGTVESSRILARFRPDAVFVTGGYGSVGVGLAARLRRLPLIVFLPDVAAGLAVRILSRVASHIAVTVPPAQALMPTVKTQLTGYPVRPAFFGISKEAARGRLNLKPGLPVLLVTGGSTGATTINRAIADRLDDLLQICQVLHISGYNDEAGLAQRKAAMSPEAQSRYHLYPYLHEEMPYAMAAADLGVMRAGASTLGELPATALPAVLIPGEFSDQAANARYLEQQGAAIMLPQSRTDSLFDTVTQLLADSPRLEAMRKAVARLSKPDAAHELARLVIRATGVRPEALA